jgi:hypothetical protein
MPPGVCHDSGKTRCGPSGVVLVLAVLGAVGGGGCIHSQADLVSSAARQAAVHGEGESPGIDVERRARPTKWLPKT